MRVIAGKFGSRRLKGAGKLRLRPTSDRLRETLFNVLGPAIEDSLFVDLYAGTGAIGIEAISRGAREVIFIEQNPAAARLIRENLAALGVPCGDGTSAEMIEASVTRGLQRLAARHRVANFVFLDPPYEDIEEHLRALELLDTSHVVGRDGLVIVEHSRKAELPERLERLERIRLLEQGDAALSFYRPAAAA